MLHFDRRDYDHYKDEVTHKVKSIIYEQYFLPVLIILFAYIKNEKASFYIIVTCLVAIEIVKSNTKFFRLYLKYRLPSRWYLQIVNRDELVLPWILNNLALVLATFTFYQLVTNELDVAITMTGMISSGAGFIILFLCIYITWRRFKKEQKL